MNVPKTAIAVFVLFVGAAGVWLSFRPHAVPPTSPFSMPGGANGTTPLPAVTTAAPSAVPLAPAPLDILPPQTPATAAAALPPVPAPVPLAPQTVPSPPAFDPASARSETASAHALKVRGLVPAYNPVNGANPVGTNAELMAAVMGKNARQAVLGPPEGLSLNPKGELVDEWGTPYFFHQLSKDVMEIHSAGPDKIMGTADDTVVR